MCDAYDFQNHHIHWLYLRIMIKLINPINKLMSLCVWWVHHSVDVASNNNINKTKRFLFRIKLTSWSKNRLNYLLYWWICRCTRVANADLTTIWQRISYQFISAAESRTKKIENRISTLVAKNWCATNMMAFIECATRFYHFVQCRLIPTNFPLWTHDWLIAAELLESTTMTVLISLGYK